MALLDIDKISVDGESLIGYTEQRDALKESDSYLFGETKVVSAKTSTEDGKVSGGSFTLDDVDTWDDDTIQSRMPEILEKMKSNGD